VGLKIPKNEIKPRLPGCAAAARPTTAEGLNFDSLRVFRYRVIASASNYF
jgi:hypothetical protein